MTQSQYFKERHKKTIKKTKNYTIKIIQGTTQKVIIKKQNKKRNNDNNSRNDTKNIIKRQIEGHNYNN